MLVDQPSATERLKHRTEDSREPSLDCKSPNVGGSTICAGPHWRTAGFKACGFRGYMDNTPYGPDFYRHQCDGSYRSAQIVLRILYGFYRPSSVIDVGCGRGAWLAAAEQLGSGPLRGLDGSWVESNRLLSSAIEFTPIDFEKPIEVDGKYDLCISLEVAEHVSEGRAAAFVETLCRASDVVLFSAAIKLQEGTCHINEQWQSYWIRLFDGRGYDCIDAIRPAVWDNENVEWWYRQNTLLFVRRSSQLLAVCTFPRSEKLLADVVHPRNYETKLRKLHRQIEHPTLKFCLRCLRRYLAIKGSRFAGRNAAHQLPRSSLD
jgi:SAM-dependent methyltransferase